MILSEIKPVRASVFFAPFIVFYKGINVYFKT